MKNLNLYNIRLTIVSSKNVAYRITHLRIHTLHQVIKQHQ